MPVKKSDASATADATTIPTQYEIKLARAVTVMGGLVTMRPCDENIIVSEEIRAEIEAQGALLDAKPV